VDLIFFKTDILHSQICIDSRRYGFIIIDGSMASFHVLDGYSKSMIFKYDKVELPKKHGRGGQSKNRFARIREEKRDWYTSKIEEFAVMHFIDSNTCVPNIDALIIAGCADLKHDLGSKLDSRLKSLVISYVDVQYSGDSGFNEAIRKSEDVLSTVEFMKEKKIISMFFESIAKGNELNVFGLKETMYALLNGAVDTLIIWNKLPSKRVEVVSKIDPERKDVKYFIDSSCYLESEMNDWDIVEEMDLLDWILEHYQDFGSKIELVGDQSGEGSQFSLGFGGLGALLRYHCPYPVEYEHVGDENIDDNVSSEEEEVWEW